MLILTKVRNHSSAESPKQANEQTKKKRRKNDWGLYPSWKHILRGLRDYGKPRCPTGAAFHRVTRPTAAGIQFYIHPWDDNQEAWISRGLSGTSTNSPSLFVACGSGWIAIGVRTTGERRKAKGGRRVKSRAPTITMGSSPDSEKCTKE